VNLGMWILDHTSCRHTVYYMLMSPQTRATEIIVLLHS